MTPPRAPRCVSWPIAGRVVRGVAVAFMLVLLVGLVAWPERHLSAGLLLTESKIVMGPIRVLSAHDLAQVTEFILEQHGEPSRSFYVGHFIDSPFVDGWKDGPTLQDIWHRDASLRVLLDALLPPSPPNWSRQTFGGQ